MTITSCIKSLCIWTYKTMELDNGYSNWLYNLWYLSGTLAPSQPIPLQLVVEMNGLFRVNTWNDPKTSFSLYRTIKLFDLGLHLSIGNRNLFWTTTITILNVHGYLGIRTFKHLCLRCAFKHLCFINYQHLGQIH